MNIKDLTQKLKNLDEAFLIVTEASCFDFREALCSGSNEQHYRTQLNNTMLFIGRKSEHSASTTMGQEIETRPFHVHLM